MRKLLFIISIILISILLFNKHRLCLNINENNYHNNIHNNNLSIIQYQNDNTNNQKSNQIEIPTLIIDSDKDDDGLKDLKDIIEGARREAQNNTKYEDGYYAGGYPPDGIGVCTDVIWRAFENAGYDLKTMVDEDIRKDISRYPRVNGSPEPNIDFRRVLNLIPFFKKFAQELTIEINPNDVENLKEWQGGDIVVFDKPNSHIAIISDKRNEDGVPYIIHNSPPYAKEDSSAKKELLQRRIPLNPLVF